MPRKPFLYTHHFPYHIMARSNNREWFYVPKSICWNIFLNEIEKLSTEFRFAVHLFVLMDNHYHMIANCSEEYNLGVVMHRLQGNVSREINKVAGKINHVFGGTYKACLIRSPFHYSQVFKYAARNPIKAGIVDKVEYYPFTTLYMDMNAFSNLKMIRVKSISNEMNQFLDALNLKNSEWLNAEFEKNIYETIKMNIKKTVFNPKNRQIRKLDNLSP